MPSLMWMVLLAVLLLAAGFGLHVLKQPYTMRGHAPACAEVGFAASRTGLNLAAPSVFFSV